MRSEAMAMKLHKWSDVRQRRHTPDELAKIDAEVQRDLLEMNLKEIREMLGKTQTEVATLAEMTQGELSRAESRADHRISTLRRIVKALGGDLEVVATFGNKSVRLGSA